MNKYPNLTAYCEHNHAPFQLLKDWGRWARSALTELDYKSPAYILAQQRSRAGHRGSTEEDELCLIDELIAKELIPYDRNLLVMRYVHGYTYREMAKKINRGAASAMRYTNSAEEVFMAALRARLKIPAREN